MNKQEKLKLCQGCRDDYYNRPGNSTRGECWCLSGAKPVERMRVGIWQNPPYRWSPETTLSCHHPEGSVWIEKNDCRVTIEPLEGE
jgi:hypothetical protein